MQHCTRISQPIAFPLFADVNIDFKFYGLFLGKSSLSNQISNSSLHSPWNWVFQRDYSKSSRNHWIFMDVLELSERVGCECVRVRGTWSNGSNDFFSKTSIYIEMYAPQSEERRERYVCVWKGERHGLKRNIDWQSERETNWISWIYARQKPALRTPLADHVMFFFSSRIREADTHWRTSCASAVRNETLIYWHFGLERIVNFVCSAISGDNEIVRQEGDECLSVCVAKYECLINSEQWSVCREQLLTLESAIEAKLHARTHFNGIYWVLIPIFFSFFCAIWILNVMTWISQFTPANAGRDDFISIWQLWQVSNSFLIFVFALLAAHFESHHQKAEKWDFSINIHWLVAAAAEQHFALICFCSVRK